MNGEDRISHRVIADRTQIKERSIARLITNHSERLERFGQLSFEITTVQNTAGAVNKQKIYYLNEHQATLLMTFLRNTDVVMNFKEDLVAEFFYLREEKEKFEKLKYSIHLKRAKTIDGKNIRHVLNGFKTQGIIARKKILEWKEIAKRNWGYVENQDRDVKSMQTEIMRLNNRLRESREEHENLKSQIKETFGGICQTN